MYDDQTPPDRVRHPLAFLSEIEQRAEQERRTVPEAASPEDTTDPSVKLLTEYVETLVELASQREEFATPPETRTFDEGHAGGCG
ncbi:DUF6269 family protein [Streptomyces sp. NPDC058045]|uniref:DUF6269 family protein n=1 Tax=Streptomyces sp. NPDC058045 TaxID=3346311 RepID=UPI0036EFED15